MRRDNFRSANNRRRRFFYYRKVNSDNHDKKQASDEKHFLMQGRVRSKGIYSNQQIRVRARRFFHIIKQELKLMH